MELGCLPFHFEVHPWMRELLDFWLERVGFG
jgi:hypothetical protein